jgi:hypothetical protein
VVVNVVVVNVVLVNVVLVKHVVTVKIVSRLARIVAADAIALAALVKIVVPRH